MSTDNVTSLQEDNFPALQKTLKIECLNKVYLDLDLAKKVCLVFMTDDELLEVNINTLKHNYYTDVITFDYSDDDDMDFSEVLISVDRVKDNATSLGVSFQSELHRVCIHGMLHLAGHTDNTTDSKNKMSELEDHYLALHCST